MVQMYEMFLLLRGLGNTLLIAVLAVLLGIVVGFLVAIIRATHDKHGGLNILNFICKVYLTIWRGTPDRKSTRLNFSHLSRSRMPSSA